MAPTQPGGVSVAVIPSWEQQLFVGFLHCFPSLWKWLHAGLGRRSAITFSPMVVWKPHAEPITNGHCEHSPVTVPWLCHAEGREQQHSHRQDWGCELL